MSSFSLNPVFLTLLVGAAMLWAATRLAPRLDLLDRPGARKQHLGAVPLVGGISVFAGAAAGLWFVAQQPLALWPFLLASGLVLVLGVFDDRASLPVKTRVLVQALAVLVMIRFGDVQLLSFGDLLGLGELVLPPWVGFVVTLVAVIGVINALNMMDGIDGLAGALGFLVLGTLGLFAWGADRLVEGWVALLFGMALLPYLLCNLGVFGSSRRVFLGDAGSMVLGMTIAWLLIALSQPAADARPVFQPVTALWLFAIPLVDTVSIMLRRKLKGQSPFLPDRDHLHHIVLRMGFRDRHALLFVVAASLVLMGLGLWMEFVGLPEWLRFALFIGFFVAYAFMLLKIWRLSRWLLNQARAIRLGIWALARPLAALPLVSKRLILLALDGALVYASLVAALLLRYADAQLALAHLEGARGLVLLAAPLVALPFFYWFGLYRSVVRYFGSQALWSAVGAVMLYTLFYGAGWLLLGASGVFSERLLPPEVITMQAVLLLLGVAGSRMLGRRLLSEVAGDRHRRLPRSGRIVEQRAMRVLIVGCGGAGRQLAAALRQDPGMQLLGFLDESAELHDRFVMGRPVINSGMLEQFVAQHRVSDVLLADERLDAAGGQARRNALLGQLGGLQVRVRLMPALDELARGQADWQAFQELQVDDLLQRPPVQLDQRALDAQCRNKTILVLGAGGNLGRALCRQLLAFEPRVLLLYEVNEMALKGAYRDLTGQLRQLELEQAEHSAVRLLPRLVPVLGSVQDEPHLREVMDTWRPALVYHAAGYADTDMVEHNPAEGLKVNLYGLLASARAALEVQVQHFVLLGNDKVERPSSILGAGRRLAETILQAFAAEPLIAFDEPGRPVEQVPNRTRFSVVRIGNLLDAPGSVVELFREQIAQGGPLTLTDPAVSRYVLTTHEAVQLVLQASALPPQGTGGQARGTNVFALDMGEPVRILQLARRMVELSGLRVKDEDNPQGDIGIRIIGLRPGERLHARQPLPAGTIPTQHARIRRLRRLHTSWAGLQGNLRALRIAVDNNDVEAIRSFLGLLVSDYQPDARVLDWVYLEQTSKP